MIDQEALGGLGDEANALAGVYNFPRLRLVRGEGSWVTASDGKRYLDMVAGLGVLALGHSHAASVEAGRKQLGLLTHCSNLFGTDPAQALAERLKALSFAERVYFCNSGAEAVEGALKFARLFAKKRGRPSQTRFVALKRSFHGRTFGALSVTASEAYRAPFAPLVPGVEFVDADDAAQAAAAIDEHVAGVIVEPIQGEGGVHTIDAGYLAQLRAACDRVGAALIFDEIQCGLGRTGKLFAYEMRGVVPDMVCLAKPLGGGLPLGAVLLGKEAAEGLVAGQHGTTFGGGPVPCAMGLVVLNTVSDPSFLATVQTRGMELTHALTTLVDKTPWLHSCRGHGLIQALVFERDVLERVVPKTLVGAAREEGLLISRAGDDALRFLPPLNLTSQDLDEAMLRLTRVIASVRL